jgi:hypothetical protein
VLLDGFLGRGQLALGVEAGEDKLLSIIPADFFDVQAKWYPWSGKFYADLGLGYAQLFWIVPSIMITGGVGWKIDVGKPNGFVLDFGAAVDCFAITGEFDEGEPSNVRAKAQIGYSW